MELDEKERLNRARANFKLAMGATLGEMLEEENFRPEAYEPPMERTSEQPAPKQDGDVVEQPKRYSIHHSYRDISFAERGKPGFCYDPAVVDESYWCRDSEVVAALTEARRGMVTLEQVEKAIRGTFGRSSWVIGEGRELAELVLAELAPKQEQKCPGCEHGIHYLGCIMGCMCPYSDGHDTREEMPR